MKQRHQKKIKKHRKREPKWSQKLTKKHEQIVKKATKKKQRRNP